MRITPSNTKRSVTILTHKRIMLLFLAAIGVIATSFVLKNVNTLTKAVPRKGIGVRTIVIDAGHGGKDPGCHGASINEKDVCLAIALRLGEYIEANYDDVNVIYTRKTDVFIELHNRAKIANDNEGDLFICIHANSGQSKAHGAETYVMGLHKTEANLKVAERENASILMEENHGQNYRDFDGSPEAFIAISLEQAAYMKQSIAFASKVQKQFTAAGRRDRGVKQAGFLVLVKTAMPSVLIETGFLTNAAEEKFLGDPEAQKSMARGIFVAFEQYKKEIEGVNSALDGHNTTPDETQEVKEPVEVRVPTPTTNDAGIQFKVQVATSSKPLEIKPSNFKGVSGVDEYVSGNMYKYTIGQTGTFDEAKELQEQLREKGFNGSFIVAFRNGLRMNLQEAIEASK
jgi:N-acetylmuramoyl-L-alanine amidase